MLLTLTKRLSLKVMLFSMSLLSSAGLWGSVIVVRERECPHALNTSPNPLFVSSCFPANVAIVLFNAVVLSFSLFLQTYCQQCAQIWVNRSFQTAMIASCLLGLPRPGNRCVLLCESVQAMRKDSSRLFHLHPDCFYQKPKDFNTAYKQEWPERSWPSHW